MTVPARYHTGDKVGRRISCPSLRVTLRGLMILAAVLAVSLKLVSQTVVAQCSCHLCHNRKEVVSRTVLWVPLSRNERATTNLPVSIDHDHEWYSYSTVSRGFLGGKGRSCSINIYADGSARATARGRKGQGMDTRTEMDRSRDAIGILAGVASRNGLSRPEFCVGSKHRTLNSVPFPWVRVFPV